MNRLSREEIAQLAVRQADPAISIYMPITSEPDQQDKNRIRLKNLTTAALTQLTADYDLRSGEAAALLEPVKELIAHGRFWAEPGASGLVVFRTADDLTIYHLPLTFQERVVVSDRFYLKPLLPLLARNGRFYILALSLGQVRLLEGTQYDVRELPLDDRVPQSLEEAMQWDDPEQRLQWHTNTGRGADRPAAYHGHGVTGDETKKENILRYFQQIDAGLQTILEDEAAPLILAAVDYLLPIYQEANSYENLLDGAVKTDPQKLSDAELHQRVWSEIFEPYLKQYQAAAAANFEDLVESDRASADLAEVVRAAHYGQVDVLFAAKEQAQWGAFNAKKDQVALHDDAGSGDYDLIDLATVQTLLHSGTVYVVAQEDVPQQQSVAAIYRYPMAA